MCVCINKLYRDTTSMVSSPYGYTILQNNYWGIRRRHSCNFPFYNMSI